MSDVDVSESISNASANFEDSEVESADDGGESSDVEEAEEAEEVAEDSANPSKITRKTVSVFVKKRAIEEYEAMNPKSKSFICKKCVVFLFLSWVPWYSFH